MELSLDARIKLVEQVTNSASGGECGQHAPCMMRPCTSNHRLFGKRAANLLCAVNLISLAIVQAAAVTVIFREPKPGSVIDHGAEAVVMVTVLGLEDKQAMAIVNGIEWFRLSPWPLPCHFATSFLFLLSYLPLPSFSLLALSPPLCFPFSHVISVVCLHARHMTVNA
jgi:hypothetical protein